MSVCPPTCVRACHFKGKFETLSCWLAVGANALDTASSHSPPDWSMSLSVSRFLSPSSPPTVSVSFICIWPIKLISRSHAKIKKTTFFYSEHVGRACVISVRCCFKWDYSLPLIVPSSFFPSSPHTGVNRLLALSCQPPTNRLLCHCHLTSPSAVCDDVNNYTQLALN